VEHLDRWGLLRTTLEDLAVRHLAYGVRPDDYAPVEEALIATFRVRLGPDFTPRAEAAWRALLRAMSETMIAAAYVHSPLGEEPT
jgi:nitric oxide dioxygenase